MKQITQSQTGNDQLSGASVGGADKSKLRDGLKNETYGAKEFNRQMKAIAAAEILSSRDQVAKGLDKAIEQTNDPEEKKKLKTLFFNIYGKGKISQLLVEALEKGDLDLAQTQILLDTLQVVRRYRGTDTYNDLTNYGKETSVKCFLNQKKQKDLVEGLHSNYTNPNTTKWLLRGASDTDLEGVKKLHEILLHPVIKKLIEDTFARMSKDNTATLSPSEEVALLKISNELKIVALLFGR